MYCFKMFNENYLNKTRVSVVKQDLGFLVIALPRVILFVNAAPNYFFYHYLSHFVYRRRTSTEINMYFIGLISLTLIKNEKVKLMT